MKQPVLLAVLILASMATAQRRPAAPVGRAPQAAASAASPVRSAMPAQLRQQLANQDAQAPRAAPAASLATAMVMPEPPTKDPATEGPQLAGKQLKAAVKKVTALQWHEKLFEAKVESAATAKPILWVQALGELDGFA